MNNKNTILFLILLFVIMLAGCKKTIPTEPPYLVPAATSTPDYAIVFSSDRSGTWEIYKMSEDGIDILQVTSSGYRGRHPDWSPDGTKIAFTSNYKIYMFYIDKIAVMDEDGKDIHFVDIGFASEQSYPAWSPDGTKIASDGEDDVYVVNADGSGPVNITDVLYANENPSWSPDGNKIAFCSRNYNLTKNIFVINSDGSGVIQLTDNDRADNFPAWSPDGTKIAFAGDVDGQYEIFLMNSDGTGQTRLTDNLFDDTCPNWSPDGSRIIFQSNRDGNEEIYIVDADGSNPVNITNNPAEDTHPDWR